MTNVIKWTYHHAFKNLWFFYTVKKNVNSIANNPKLTNEQKCNRIYYHVFWETWHICGEPVLYNNDGLLLSLSNFILGVLNKLNFHEPLRIKKQEQQFENSLSGFGLGILVSTVNYDLSLWHFGADQNLNYCWQKAFKSNM